MLSNRTSLGTVAAVGTVLILLARFALDTYILKKKGWEAVHVKTFINSFVIGITVLVVAVPEGLPLAVTLALAYSVKVRTYSVPCYFCITDSCCLFVFLLFPLMHILQSLSSAGGITGAILRLTYYDFKNMSTGYLENEYFFNILYCLRKHCYEYEYIFNYFSLNC